MQANTSPRGEAPTAAMRTGELARRAGVNVETLRYYERRGLLPEPARRPSGHREYPPAALDRMRAIKRAQRLGFTLSEIERLLGPRGRRPTLEVQATAAAKLVELDERLQDMLDMRAELRVLVELDCDALVGCTCERVECPVAHDERVAQEPGECVEEIAAATDAADGAGRPRAKGLPAGVLAAVGGAMACLACLLPLLGIGVLATAAAGEPVVDWEMVERVGFVVAVILGSWLLLRGRVAGARCGRCGSAPPARNGG